MIKVPDNFRPSDCGIKLSIQNPVMEPKKNDDGSFSLRAGYAYKDVSDFVREAAREMNEKMEAELIDELLRLNGYVPERMCKAERDYDAMDNGIPDCRIWKCSCGESFPFWRGLNPCFCPNCGAKVVE